METSNLNINLATSLGTYQVKPLATLAAIPLESTQYLCRKIEKESGKQSMGVIIDAVDAEDCISNWLENDTILSGVVAWINSQREEVAKELIAAGKSEIIPDELNIVAVAKYLESQSIKQGRVSKLRLQSWFDSDLCEELTRAFTAKLGAQFASNNELRKQTIECYRDAFAQLAKREVEFPPEVCSNLKSALNLAPESAMKEYCKNKLEASKQKTPQMLGL